MKNKKSKIDRLAGLLNKVNRDKKFSGTLKTRHKSYDPDLKEFKNLDSYSPLNRYDNGGGDYGADVTYLDAKGNFTNPQNSMQDLIGGRAIYDVDATFDNALVVTPKSPLIKKYAPEGLVKYAKENGYDGLVMEGFADVEDHFYNNPSKMLEHTDDVVTYYPELDSHTQYTRGFQDQVISFKPEDQTKVIGKAPYSSKDLYLGDDYYDTVVTPKSSKIPDKASNFDANKFISRKSAVRKITKTLPWIGAAMGLTAPDMAEAVLPTGDVHTDKAIEDPSSPEFKKRRSLWDSLEGK